MQCGIAKHIPPQWKATKVFNCFATLISAAIVALFTSPSQASWDSWIQDLGDQIYQDAKDALADEDPEEGEPEPKSGTKSDSQVKSSPPADAQNADTARYESDWVMEMQTHLALLGYDPGPIDGAFGGRTKAAILAFQGDAALPPTGRPTLGTMDALRSSKSSSKDIVAEVLSEKTQTIGIARTNTRSMDRLQKAAWRDARNLTISRLSGAHATRAALFESCGLSAKDQEMTEYGHFVSIHFPDSLDDAEASFERHYVQSLNRLSGVFEDLCDRQEFKNEVRRSDNEILNAHKTILSYLTKAGIADTLGETEDPGANTGAGKADPGGTTIPMDIAESAHENGYIGDIPVEYNRYLKDTENMHSAAGHAVSLASILGSLAARLESCKGVTPPSRETLLTAVDTKYLSVANRDTIPASFDQYYELRRKRLEGRVGPNDCKFTLDELSLAYAGHEIPIQARENPGLSGSEIFAAADEMQAECAKQRTSWINCSCVQREAEKLLQGGFSIRQVSGFVRKGCIDLKQRAEHEYQICFFAVANSPEDENAKAICSCASAKFMEALSAQKAVGDISGMIVACRADVN